MQPSPFSRIADVIETDWQAQARPEQLPPPGEWFGWVISSGRGWGKTRTGAEWIRAKAESGAAKRMALIGSTASDVRDTMILGESGLLAVCPAWNRPIFEPSYRRVTWPNGAIATAYSAEEADRLRGPQHDAAWCDELGAWRNRDSTWDMLQFGLRLGSRPQVLVTTTPKPVKLLKDLLKRPDFVVTRGRTADNADNLAPSFLRTIVSRYQGTRLGRQELEAELLEDVEGALWSRDRIDELRVSSAPPLRRIVVAIDPAVSVGEASDETGIIVAAVGVDGHGYVLQDASGKFSPTEWASKAVTLYRKWSADRIIAETNMGGDLVENTLRVVDENVPFKKVHASRGKITRAEPISALYEQGRVHHVGAFPELEDQLCTFEPGSKNSPDRLDAMVWALTDLCVASDGTAMIEFYRREAEATERGETLDRRSPADMAGAAMVRMLAPADVSTTIYLMSGRTVLVPQDHIVEMSEFDAAPMRMAGWLQLEKAEL